MAEVPQWQDLSSQNSCITVAKFAAFASAPFGEKNKNKKIEGLIFTDFTTLLHSMCSFLISKRCFQHLTRLKSIINSYGHPAATLLGCHRFNRFSHETSCYHF